MTTQVVPQNEVLCLNCKTQIRSTHKHHHISCNCKDPLEKITIEGGTIFYKRSFGEKAWWTDIDGKTYYGGIHDARSQGK